VAAIRRRTAMAAREAVGAALLPGHATSASRGDVPGRGVSG
jgi:hypothetical protein